MLKDNLQGLFNKKILDIKQLNKDAYDTNDVYSVSTTKYDYILKILKDTNVNKTSFWQGLNILFNKTIKDSIKSQKNIAEFLNQINVIPAPKIYKSDHTSKNILKAPYIIMERMLGEAVLSNSDLETYFTQNKDISYQLGRFLSMVHSEQFNFFGNASFESWEINHFPAQLSEAIRILGTRKKAREDLEVQRLLPLFIEEAREIKIPTEFSLIMLDLWPSQFLVSEGQISAVVDLESYVIGPVGLELTLLELWLHNLGIFKEGYFFEKENREWPDFEREREIYRFFLYLLYDCPPRGLDACLNSRAKFSQQDRVKSRLVAPKPRPKGYSNPSTPFG